MEKEEGQHPCIQQFAPHSWPGACQTTHERLSCSQIGRRPTDEICPAVLCPTPPASQLATPPDWWHTALYVAFQKRTEQEKHALSQSLIKSCSQFPANAGGISWLRSEGKTRLVPHDAHLSMLLARSSPVQLCTFTIGNEKYPDELTRSWSRPSHQTATFELGVHNGTPHVEFEKYRRTA